VDPSCTGQPLNNLASIVMARVRTVLMGASPDSVPAGKTNWAAASIPLLWTTATAHCKAITMATLTNRIVAAA
jgi:hypothetical protein